MNNRILSQALALAALVALCIYVLACTSTSFSPNDKQVAYAAVDPETGQLGVAVYDRETRRSEMVFLPPLAEGNTMCASAWLDNRRLLVVWPADDRQDETLRVTVLPRGAGPVREFGLNNIHERVNMFMGPLTVVGEWLFAVNQSNQVERLNIRTGETKVEAGIHKEQVWLWPDPEGKSCFFSTDNGDHDGVLGRIDPETLERKTLLTLTNQMAALGILDGGRRIVLCERSSDHEERPTRLVVWKDGAEVFSRPLDLDTNLALTGILLTPAGDRLIESYCLKTPGTNLADFGLLEIPLNDRPIRQTVVLKGVPMDDESEPLFFQVGVSHDGSTAAVASTYFAVQNKQFKTEDCALFMVDLSHPKRPVTKVPIPAPKRLGKLHP
jgi:hypothetical protein